jgi:F0F1-type ATP synthase assembly protein I
MKGKVDNQWWMVSIVGEIGFLIVIPLVILAILGRMVDAMFSSFPLFFLIGILCAIIASTYIIYRRITTVLKEIETESDTTPRTDEHPEEKNL